MAVTDVNPPASDAPGVRTGSIPLADLAGGLDLQATLESAQSFLWGRADGETYERASAHGGDAWYYTVTDGEVVFARRRGDRLAWRATTDATGVLRRRLRLDDDLSAVFAAFPDDEPLARARAALPGLRVVRDPLFPCLVSFICSARTSVERIHAFQRALAREYGDAVAVDGRTYYEFPTPTRLATASEEDLRELGLGFRAPRVAATAADVAEDPALLADCREQSYRDARESLQSFHGVGPKVADCVCLFALGHLEAVPVDTWTRKLVERYYPALASDGYGATASAFRDRFGEHAGYAQTYLYHYERE